MLPTPTAFCQCLIWIDAGVSVQNPQLPRALQTHFCHSAREVMLSSCVHSFSCISWPCGTFWSSSCEFVTSSAARQKITSYPEESCVSLAKESSVSNVNCLHQLKNIGPMNQSRSFMMLQFIPPAAGGCLIPLYMGYCLQLQTKEVLTGIFIVCLNFSNSKHKARL